MGRLRFVCCISLTKYTIIFLRNECRPRIKSKRKNMNYYKVKLHNRPNFKLIKQLIQYLWWIILFLVLVISSAMKIVCDNIVLWSPVMPVIREKLPSSLSDQFALFYFINRPDMNLLCQGKIHHNLAHRIPSSDRLS